VPCVPGKSPTRNCQDRGPIAIRRALDNDLPIALSIPRMGGDSAGAKIRQLHFVARPQDAQCPLGWSPDTLISTTNLSEWDHIAFPLSVVPQHSDTIGTTQRFQFATRVGQLLAWVKAGRTLAIIIDEPTRELFRDGSLVPLDAFQTSAGTGRLVELANLNAPPKQLVTQLKNARYEYLLSLPAARPFMVVKQTIPGPLEVVGAVLPLGSGHIVLAPMFYFDTLLDWGEYLGGLFSIPEAIKLQMAPIPDWAMAFAVSPELEWLEQIKAANKAVEEWLCWPQKMRQ
jgi:hypothetical protein